MKKLGLADTTFLVMGGIVGSGIFMNPHVVAGHAPSYGGALGAWVLGGAIALAGGFIWAELAERNPGVGGQYAYLRDGWHPAVGFLYGWSNLLVVQTGGMAAVSVTFARYMHAELAVAWPESLTAAAALAVLTAVNLLGIRTGGRVQSVLMAMKIAAIGALIVAGLAIASPAAAAPAQGTSPQGFFAAMIAVMFAYGGWATATFVAGEIEDSTRTLPRALVIGTAGVVALYVGVNLACLRTLGVDGLVAIDAPATEVMRRAVGAGGAAFVAIAISLSTFGFLAQGMLACPRVYYAMAHDKLFFASLGRLHPRTGVPHVAIVVQGILAIVTAVSGSYEEILSWVVTADFVFLAATAATLLQVPGRSLGRRATTVFFAISALATVAACFYQHPMRSTLGWLIVGSGVPVYLYWRRRTAPA